MDYFLLLDTFIVKVQWKWANFMDLTFSLLNLLNFRFSHNLQCWMIYPRDITSTVLSFNYVHSYIIYYKPCKWWSVYHLSSWYLCFNQSYRWKCIVDRLLTITEQVIRGPQTCKYLKIRRCQISSGGNQCSAETWHVNFT